MDIKLEDLEKWAEEGYKFGKALHKLHKNNLKSGYVDMHLKKVVDGMIENKKSFREFKKERKKLIKEIDEKIYEEKREKIKVIE